MRLPGTRINALHQPTIMLNLVYEVHLKTNLQLRAKQPAEISNRYFHSRSRRSQNDWLICSSIQKSRGAHVMKYDLFTSYELEGWKHGVLRNRKKSWFVSQLWMCNSSSNFWYVLAFLWARKCQNKAQSQNALPDMKHILSEPTESWRGWYNSSCSISQESWRGWYNSPCSISHLYLDFPHTGEGKSCLYQAEKPDSKWLIRLEFIFSQFPDFTFIQMSSNRRSHQDTSSHGPDKQGPHHTLWSRISPSRQVLYLPGWSFL